MVSGRHNPARRRHVVMVVDNGCNPDRRVLKEAGSLAQDGCEVTIIAWDRQGGLPAEEMPQPGVRIRRFAIGAGHNLGLRQLPMMLRFWFSAARLLHRLDADVVHCHDLPSLPVGVLGLLGRRRPLVYDAHEIYWLMMRTRLPRSMQVMLRHFEDLLLGRVDEVVTVSTVLGEYFGRRHPRVTVVGNWYDPSTPDTEAAAALREQLGIPPQAFVIGSIGFLSPERFHELLIDYAAITPGVQVVVAGTGAVEAELRAAAERLPNLHYLGWASRPEVVYAASDAIFYGLRGDDAYSDLLSPNTLFLSIALGRPLVTTALCEAGRVVSASGAGEIIDPPTPEGMSGAIDRLRAPGRWADVVEAQRRLQATYSWQRANAELRSVYDRIGAATEARRRVTTEVP